MKIFVVPVVIGLVLGAVPATVMEFIQPVWDPEVITAFAMPMLALGTLGLLIGVVLDYRHYRRKGNTL